MVIRKWTTLVVIALSAAQCSAAGQQPATPAQQPAPEATGDGSVKKYPGRQLVNFVTNLLPGTGRKASSPTADQGTIEQSQISPSSTASTGSVESTEALPLEASTVAQAQPVLKPAPLNIVLKMKYDALVAVSDENVQKASAVTIEVANLARTFAEFAAASQNLQDHEVKMAALLKGLSKSAKKLFDAKFTEFEAARVAHLQGSEVPTQPFTAFTAGAPDAAVVVPVAQKTEESSLTKALNFSYNNSGKITAGVAGASVLVLTAKVVYAWNKLDARSKAAGFGSFVRSQLAELGVKDPMTYVKVLGAVASVTGLTVAAVKYFKNNVN